MIIFSFEAELAALHYNIGRSEQDQFAARSHSQWVLASNSGRFQREIVTIEDAKGALINQDEGPRADITVTKLAKLKTCFNLPSFVTSPDDGKVVALPNGCKHEDTITPGNCSSLNDGAACVVLTTSSFLKRRLNQSDAACSKGLTRIVAYAQSAGQPEFMGLEPVNAVKQALAKSGWAVENVDYWEINEAFAVTSIITIKQLGIPDWENRVNVNGGAISIGHPLGATGARLVVTLSHQLAMMQASNPQKIYRGVATACIGGGQGIAICLESIPPTYFDK